MSLLNLRNKYEREECCGVATEKQIECTAMENREVAAEREFLYIVRNMRPMLLAHLQDLGLLPAFLEAESGTKQEP